MTSADFEKYKNVIDKFSHGDQIAIIDNLLDACGIKMDYFEFKKLNEGQQKAIYRDIKIKMLLDDNS